MYSLLDYSHFVYILYNQAIVKLSDGSGLVFSVRSFSSPLGNYMGDGLMPDMLHPTGQPINYGHLTWCPFKKQWAYGET